MGVHIYVPYLCLCLHIYIYIKSQKSSIPEKVITYPRVLNISCHIDAVDKLSCVSLKVQKARNQKKRKKVHYQHIK